MAQLVINVMKDAQSVQGTKIAIVSAVPQDFTSRMDSEFHIVDKIQK